GADQADDDIGILSAPAAERGVEAVDTQQVLTPDRQIAAARTLPASALQFSRRPKRQGDERGQTIDLAAQPRSRPGDVAPQFRRQLAALDPGAERRRHHRAVAGDEPASFGQAAMGRYKTRTGNAVAIEKDA